LFDAELQLVNRQRSELLNTIGVAVVSTLLAMMLRWLMNPLLGEHLPFATFFIGVALCVHYANQWAALAVALGGLAWGALLYFPKGLSDVETISASVLYLFCALVIIALGQRMHEAERLSEGRARQLVDNLRILSASQGRLQLATEVGGTGVFQWDARLDRFEGENPEAYRIFGRQPGQAKLSLAAFLEQHVHPADAAMVRRGLELARRPTERLHAEFRIRRGGAGEDWRWVEVVGRFLFGESSTPTHLIGVINDVTERREMEDTLRRMAADLSDADHRKDEFLATLAHELRNPLAPIRNGIELLKRQSSGQAQTESVVGVMERQMGHLVRLVDDLIDVSRITRNKLELRRQAVELAPVVHAAVEACRPLLDGKQHELEVVLPPMPVHVDADPTRLVQVLANLLNNACKYTDRGGHVRIALERQGQQAVLTVGDDGNGIPQDMLPRVFDMFIQLDRSMERTQGGLGIGLSMVKRLVELHEGSVSIHSQGEGKGTRVVVRLPTVFAPMPATGAPTVDGERVPAPRRRILVADDNADAAHSLASVLELMGNEVRTAGDGQEALDAAPGFAPDLVMLDIGMPRLNGYEACRRLRELEGGGELVIIAVTGWGQDEDRERSREAGFDLHLTKPVDPLAVEALLGSLPPPRPR
jgi:PAS domain S-box-containing protein